MRFFIAALFAFVLSTVPALATRFSPDDLARIVAITDPQISPDGRTLLVVVTHSSLKDNHSHPNLVDIDTGSGTKRDLQTDVNSLSNVRWLPDGKSYAFIANDKADGSGKTQIYVAPIDTNVATQITHSATGVQQFALERNGKQIAYVAADPLPAREKFDKSFAVGNNDYLVTEPQVPAHVWLVNADGNHNRQITRGAWSLPRVLPPSSPASPLTWSPDGRYLTIAHRITPYSGDARFSVVEVLDVRTGALRKLTGHSSSESNGAFSPSGKWISYSYPRGGKKFIGDGVYVAPAKGGNGTDIAYALDRNIVGALWIDDKRMLLAGHDGSQSALWIAPLHGKAQRLALGDIQPREPFAFDGSVRNGALAFVGSTPTHPSEIYYLSSLHARPRVLTHYNDAIAALNLGHNRVLHWTNGKFAEDGILTTPPNFDSHKRYPLVLYIHGGPVYSSGIGFGAFPQLIAAHNYVVFEPNYRGSDNLGNAYEHAIALDRAPGPGTDILAGLRVVDALPFVNAHNACVTGWSYGGTMTAWMSGRYPSLWKCAIDGAANVNFYDGYTISDGNAGRGWDYYGSPFLHGNGVYYREQSPISVAPHITAPTLILGDVGDYRVPIVNSYELYHALRDNGTHVEFIAYAVHGHFPSDPYNARDVFRRWVAWLDRYLR